MDEAQKHFQKIIDEQNKQALDDFDGLSPTEMHTIVHDPFSDESPLKLMKLKSKEYRKIPILNVVKAITTEIKAQSEIELTKVGNLPPKIVKKIYAQGFLKEDALESGITKLSNESDSISISLSKFLIDLAGISKIKKKKLSLTKKGAEIIEDDQRLFELIFKTYCEKFFWGYFDGSDSRDIGQMGFAFSIVLVAKYGNKHEEASFYADKYFKAFPQLKGDENIPHYASESMEEYCYKLRTFTRFMDFFGFIEISNKQNVMYISKSGIFDKLFKFG